MRNAILAALLVLFAVTAHAAPHVFTFVTPCTNAAGTIYDPDSLACLSGTTPLLDLAAVELWGVKQGERADRRLVIKALWMACNPESLAWESDSGFVWTCWVRFIDANGHASCHSNLRTINATASVPGPMFGAWFVYDIQGRLRASYRDVTEAQAVSAAKALPWGVYMILGPRRVSIVSNGR